MSGKSPKTTCKRKKHLSALLLFAFLFGTYLSNGYVAGNNDATANVRLSFQLLDHGTLGFTVEESPYMFIWKLRMADREIRARFRAWNAPAGSTTIRGLLDRGDLTLVQPKYYLVQTQVEGAYANTFGLGAGLFALPIAAAAAPFMPKVERDPLSLWRIGKVASSAAVAGGVVCLFLTAQAHLSLTASFLVALVLGVCTCLWSVSSQLLIQHGPAGFFLSLGTYFLSRKYRWSHLGAGLGFSAAAACRPTCILVVGVLGLWLLLRHRQEFLRFTLGCLPIAIPLAIYGWHYFGNPFSVGQMQIGAQVAMSKTGSPDVWQTPFLSGAAGLLFSPSRGLFIYSPVLVVGLWGLGRVWRDPAFSYLRPLSIGALCLFIPAAKRFDWWGGWTYGYRPLMEVAVLLAFLSLPLVTWIQGQRWRMVLVGLLAVWSMGTQVVGAYAYDLSGWNGRKVYDVLDEANATRSTFDDQIAAEGYSRQHGGRVSIRELNIDRPEYRYRLWSVVDSPIVYYIREWQTARSKRVSNAHRFIREEG